MPANMLSSLTDENRHLRKQMGCMNGIFQLFDRRHFLAGRSISSHRGKTLLLGGAQQQKEPHDATKAVIEKDLEAQTKKTRVSSKSSQAPNSSSCSSTFSSLGYNTTPQPETIPPRQINTSESPFQITAMKQQKHSSTKGLQSPDFRDVVKDSMYREARGVPIKSYAHDERKLTVMKHVDSPRPLQQSKVLSSKATIYEGSTRGFAKVQEGTRNSKDERLALPRLSYDGRESRDTFKTNTKLKELPRFSLDSKPNSMKRSAPESRFNFLGCDPHMGTENSTRVPPVNQESGSHSRSNSIVAKLMGLAAFPDSITTDESSITKTKSSPSPSPRVASLSESSKTAELSKQKQASSSPPFSQKNPASPSPRLHNANSVRKTTTCSRLPIEPAPWKQKDSPKMATQSGKAPTNSPHPSSSVYGEIEKRIADLEFKRSGKDLRALKQILEAMQKTRKRLENQRGESAELTIQSSLGDGSSNKNSNLSTLQNTKTNQHQVVAIKGSCPPKQLGSSIGLMKSRKAMEKVRISSSNRVSGMETLSLQNLQTQDPEYHRENPAHKEKVKYRTPRCDNMKEANQRLSSIDKRTTCRNLELQRTLKAPQRTQVENCTTSERGSRMVSPRVQHIVSNTERGSHPSELGKVKKQSSTKVKERCPQNRKHRVKSADLQLSDDQSSNLSSETRYSSYHGDTASTISESNNSIASHIKTEVISLANSISTNSREQQDYATTSKEQRPAVEFAATMMEQPSPVSVLDTPFYSDGSPSPVKRIAAAFRDESSSPDEAEWHFENLKYLTDCTKFDPGYKYNQKSEDLLHTVREPRLLKTEANAAVTDHNESAYKSINPGHRYIKKILLAPGLLKDTSIIQTADQLLSSRHLTNSDMLHAREVTDDPLEEAIGELIEKNYQMKSNSRIQRKIVSDMINEMLARKINSGGLFTLGRKRMSPQGLIKEVYLEMDHLCRLPYCNLDDEDDGSIRLLTADMKYLSEDWTAYSGEVPALALDIERLIFKDLINEVVTCEAVGRYDWPKRHCRQLFNK